MKTHLIIAGCLGFVMWSITTQAQHLFWAKQFGGGNLDEGRSIAVDAAGNVYASGSFQGTADFDPGLGTFNLTSAGTGNNRDVFITKLDAAGNLVWAKQFGGGAHDHGRSIAVDAAGNVYATGYFAFTVDFDPGPGAFNLTSAGTYDVFITKLDASGNLIWAKHFGGADGEYVSSLAVDAAGNVHAIGDFRGVADFDPGIGVFNLTSSGYEDIFIAKLDAVGNLVWAKQFGSANGNDYGNSIAVDAAGNVYATGFFED